MVEDGRVGGPGRFDSSPTPARTVTGGGSSGGSSSSTTTTTTTTSPESLGFQPGTTVIATKRETASGGTITVTRGGLVTERDSSGRIVPEGSFRARPDATSRFVQSVRPGAIVITDRSFIDADTMAELRGQSPKSSKLSDTFMNELRSPSKPELTPQTTTQYSRNVFTPTNYTSSLAHGQSTLDLSGRSIREGVKKQPIKYFVYPDRTYKSDSLYQKIDVGLGGILPGGTKSQPGKLDMVKGELKHELTSFSGIDLIPGIKFAKVGALTVATGVGYGMKAHGWLAEQYGKKTRIGAIERYGQWMQEKPFEGAFVLGSAKIGGKGLERIYTPTKTFLTKGLIDLGLGATKANIGAGLISAQTTLYGLEKASELEQKGIEQLYFTPKMKNLLEQEGKREEIEKVVSEARKLNEPRTGNFWEKQVAPRISETIEFALPTLKENKAFDKYVTNYANKKGYDADLYLGTAKVLEKADAATFTQRVIGPEIIANMMSSISPGRWLAGGTEGYWAWDATLDRYKVIDVPFVEKYTGVDVEMTDKWNFFSSKDTPGRPAYSSLSDPSIKTKIIETTPFKFELMKSDYENRKLTQEQFINKDFENIQFVIKGKPTTKSTDTATATSVPITTQWFGYNVEATEPTTSYQIGRGITMPVVTGISALSAAGWRGAEKWLAKKGAAGSATAEVAGQFLDFPEEPIGDIFTSGVKGRTITSSNVMMSGMTGTTSKPINFGVDVGMSYGLESFSPPPTKSPVAMPTKKSTSLSSFGITDSFTDSTSFTSNVITKPTRSKGKAVTSTDSFANTNIKSDVWTDVMTEVTTKQKTDTGTDSFTETFTKVNTNLNTNINTETFTTVMTPDFFIPPILPKGGGGSYVGIPRKRKSQRTTRFTPSLGGIITGRGAREGDLLTGIEMRTTKALAKNKAKLDPFKSKFTKTKTKTKKKNTTKKKKSKGRKK